jgi:hypothetical protein
VCEVILVSSTTSLQIHQNTSNHHVWTAALLPPQTLRRELRCAFPPSRDKKGLMTRTCWVASLKIAQGGALCLRHFVVRVQIPGLSTSLSFYIHHHLVTSKKPVCAWYKLCSPLSSQNLQPLALCVSSENA